MKDKILQAITIPDILQKYGYKLGRHNRIPCMLHGGTHNNLGYTDKVFNCFVCSQGGNVISLVMQLHNLDFKSAMIRINYDFGLGFTNDKPTLKDRIKAREIQKQREAESQRIIKQDKLYLKLVCDRQKLFIQDRPTEWIDELLDNPGLIKYLGMEMSI